METPTAFRRSVAAVAPTVGWACAKGPPQDRGYDGPPQDSLAAVIRTIRAGEEAAYARRKGVSDLVGPSARARRRPERDVVETLRTGTIRAGEEAAGLAEAVAAAARIPPEQVGDELQDAMERALALTIAAEDSVLGGLGAVLEEALGAVWSQADLAAAMREIPSETGYPTARQRVAARLANRLGAAEAGEDLRAAMAEAFTSVWGDRYPMYEVRDELAVRRWSKPWCT